MPRIVTRGLGADTRLTVRAYGARPELPVYVEGASFWDVVRAYLLLAPTLSDLTDIYFWSAKPGFKYPFMIVSPIQDTPEVNNSELYLESSDVQFSVVCSGPTCDEDAEAIGQAAYRWLAPKALNDAGEVISRPRLVSTYANETAAIPGRKYRAMQPGRGPNNQNVFAFHFRYTFLVTRSMVVR